ncbi:hypothetical protein BST81_25050 [Leptolyngbya sp. 'hensonii']|uniref:SGNH/GDSL hydrolase family protein n=1 Tax=Leptolyngbya sp. 'hensonii' TaxID=1922337 RepID=UPI00095024F5|nr:SGNH/GDSL hydrolase family protein [Leptolyngbya sp. 'hensonii']OLP15699.1 hypothetical protein BST81_25050 [Leptolyngbya sp. 'hensonii']
MKGAKRYRRLLGAIAFLVIVAVIEISLRLGFGLGDPVLLQAEPDLGYRFQPNQSKVRFGRKIAYNQFSQRSDPTTLIKPAGRLRILMTGDSVLNGGAPIDQSQTITALFQTQLQQAGHAAEVLNASTGSWGIGNVLAYLKRFGTFASDALILEIGNNDLVQPTSTPDRVGRDPDYPDRPPGSAIQEVMGRYLWPSIALRLGFQPGSTEIPTAVDPVAQLEANQRDLQQIIALARAQALPIFVVFVPQRYSLLPALWVSPYKAPIFSILKSLDVPIVDVQQIWSELPADVIAAYFRDYDHLTVAGNQAIATLLFQRICVAKQLPACIPRQ